VLLLVAGIALYYAIVNWIRTAERERAIILVLVGSGLLATLLAPVAVAWGTGIQLTFIPEALYRRLPRLASIPVNPNVLAGALVLTLPVPLALLVFGASQMQRHERYVSLAAVIGMAAILLLTKSRGALLASAVSVLILCLLCGRRGWIVAIATALLAGLTLWRIDFPQMLEKLISTGSTGVVPGRLEMWSRALYMLQDFPFTGIGMGAYQDVANALYPFFLLGPDANAPHAHNLFLQVGVDLGIPREIERHRPLRDVADVEAV
jgi:putative inorganic carbon (HCO3(-)) transporter